MTPTILMRVSVVCLMFVLSLAGQNLSAQSARQAAPREINGIENKTVAAWHSMPKPTLTGQPPTFQVTGYQAVQMLGKLMNYDKNMSPLKNQACASCHMP